LLEVALVSRTALLELHAFLTQQVGDEPEQLQRELRRRFGMQWTMSVRSRLIFLKETCEMAWLKHGLKLYRHLAMRILEHLRLLFQAMVSGVMSDSLPTETKAILCRKWTAMMPLQMNQRHFWGQLHLQMRSLVA
jgi:hypothetical protein